MLGTEAELGQMRLDRAKAVKALPRRGPVRPNRPAPCPALPQTAFAAASSVRPAAGPASAASTIPTKPRKSRRFPSDLRRFERSLVAERRGGDAPRAERCSVSVCPCQPARSRSDNGPEMPRAARARPLSNRRALSPNFRAARPAYRRPQRTDRESRASRRCVGSALWRHAEHTHCDGGNDSRGDRPPRPAPPGRRHSNDMRPRCVSGGWVQRMEPRITRRKRHKAE